MSALQEVFARFTTVFDTSALARGEAATNAATGALTRLGAVLLGGAALRGIHSFVEETVDMADELRDTSIVLGTTTHDLQALRYAGDLAGVSQGELGAALTRATRAIAAGAPALRRLGVSTRDAHGQLRPVRDVLLDLADPVSDVASATQRGALLMDIFGRSGARMGLLFEDGREGLSGVLDEFDRLGGGLGEDAINAAAELDDANKRLDASFTAIRGRLALYLLPTFERFAELGTRVATGLQSLHDRGHLAEVAFTALGIAAAAAAGKSIVAWLLAAAPMVAMVLVIGGVVLAIEDMIVATEGGQSAFRAWALEGQEAMSGLVATGLLFVSLLKEAYNLIARIVPGIEPLGDIVDIQRDARSEEEAELARRQLDRDREARGLSEVFTPDDFERAQALRSARQQIDRGISPELQADLQRGAAAERGAQFFRTGKGGLAARGRSMAGITTTAQQTKINNITINATTQPMTPDQLRRTFEQAMSVQVDDASDAVMSVAPES